MQTRFSEASLQDSTVRESEAILRKCVHCGFCSATCPTYLLTGDELDSPRGRIYLIKEMLENDRPATKEVVQHIDRCLSCLACMTTCPSGVHYQHLVDHARAHIEATYERPWTDRLARSLLAAVMPYPRRFRAALLLARLARPLQRLLPRRLAAMLALVPAATPVAAGAVDWSDDADAVPSGSRVAVMTGCVQSVLGQSANDATIRLLRRMGLEPAIIDTCCGSLTHHLGREEQAQRAGAEFIGQFEILAGKGPVDAVIANASGCGTHLKDYGFVFRDDSSLAGSAGQISELAHDVCEFVLQHALPPVTRPGKLRVAYHSACSLQHGQKITEAPVALLRAAGFDVLAVPEGHICCGSAGTYNMLQPEMASRLLQRKVENIAALNCDLVAAGNLGCMTQLASGLEIPVIHTVELLDWATGGPKPAALN